MPRTVLAFLLLAAAVPAQEQARQRLLRDVRLKMQVEDHQGAIGLLDRALETAPTADLLVWRGRAKSALHDPAGALEDFQAAYRKNPGARGVRVLAAQALRELGRYEEALKAYDAEVDEAGDNAATPRWARARLRELTGDYKGARADYDWIVQKNPKFHAVYLQRADLRRTEGDFAGARADYEAALAIDGRDAGTHAGLARAFFEEGDVEKARKGYDRAVTSMRYSAYGPSARGHFHLARGEWSEAKSDFLHAVDLDPAGDYDRLYLCLAYHFLGRAEHGRKRLGKHLDGRAAKEMRTTKWYAAVAGFLAGRASEEELFAAAGQGPTKWRQREQRCEAYWYAGAVRLAAGDKEGAIRHLEACVATDVRGFLEHFSAKMTLARLKKES